MSCKPKDFYGNDGAIGLLRWLDKIQAVLRISDCLETHKVRYAANSFQGKALNWWNNQIQARGIDEAESMEWEEFKALLLEEYCPINELQKLENEFWHLTMKGADLMAYNDRFHELSSLLPHMVNSEARKIERYIWGLAPQIGSMVTASRPTTLKSAILLAGQLRDHLVRTNAFENKNSGEKRKLDNPNTSNHSNHTNQTNHSNHFKKPNNNKKPATVRNYGAVNQERKNQHAPKCAKCNFFHFGTCLVCTKCGKPGHQANNCRSNPTPRACYGSWAVGVELANKGFNFKSDRYEEGKAMFLQETKGQSELVDLEEKQVPQIKATSFQVAIQENSVFAKSTVPVVLLCQYSRNQKPFDPFTEYSMVGPLETIALWIVPSPVATLNPFPLSKFQSVLRTWCLGGWILETTALWHVPSTLSLVFAWWNLKTTGYGFLEEVGVVRATNYLYLFVSRQGSYIVHTYIC
ncbi:hypothetical protein E3N88_23106 [Mikania micrantha]|uniref:CCHC-type domain-containing protein n=1 Tax=Mikania micrantha TaxID=192012 RepID=A0A5N6NF01_9ASTR|nr:hypothetical protein E3N88_23106 [Mikania micrantha]